MDYTVLQSPVLCLQLSDALVLFLVSRGSGSSTRCLAFSQQSLPQSFKLLKYLFLEGLQIGLFLGFHCIIKKQPLCSSTYRVSRGLFSIQYKSYITPSNILVADSAPSFKITKEKKICQNHQQKFYMFLTTNTNPRQDMRTLSTVSAHPDQSEPDEITWNPEATMEKHKESHDKIDLTQVFRASQYFSQSDVIVESTLFRSDQLSKSFEAEILLKREDSQKGRTFKIRGAYFQYLVSDEHRKKEGYVIVSDGNFATSYAIVSGLYKTRCVIFLPFTCHQHKLQKIKSEGKEFVEVIQVGKDFQECTDYAVKYAAQHKMPMLKSFDTLTLLHGFATIAKEIVESLKKEVDYILVPCGGGGLACAIASVIKQISPNTKVIAVEPDICKPFSESILSKHIQSYDRVSKFCNGSSVKNTSENAYRIGLTSVDGFVEVSERKLAEKIIKLYSQGIICQPSGALAVAGLQKMRHLIKGKTVVCIMSGANIDLTKLDEARQMAMVSKGIKNHYHFHLPNRKNIMYELITTCFKPTDIISIQYSQRFGKQQSQALISIESRTQDDVEEYLTKLNEGNYHFENINQKEDMLDIFF